MSGLYHERHRSNEFWVSNSEVLCTDVRTPLHASPGPHRAWDAMAQQVYGYAREHTPLPMTGAVSDWSDGTPADALGRAGLTYTARAAAPTVSGQGCEGGPRPDVRLGGTPWRACHQPGARDRSATQAASHGESPRTRTTGGSPCGDPKVAAAHAREVGTSALRRSGRHRRSAVRHRRPHRRGSRAAVGKTWTSPPINRP
jgi:hypothetical protein